MFEDQELLKLYGHCQTFNTLPGPGGVLDQDCVLMQAFNIVAAAIAEKREMESKRK